MISRRLPCSIALLLLCMAGQATGEDAGQTDAASGSFRARFPSGSFDSTAKADAALAAVGSARLRAEGDYKSAARACLGKFFVNDCVDAARTARRVRMSEIEAVEIEANRAKRQERGARVEAERARREAERKTAAPSDARTRAQNREEFDKKQANEKQNVADRARTAAARSASPPRRVPAIKKPPRQDGNAEAVQRRKNAVQQADKVRQAAEHRAQIEKRRAQKEADRARRTREKAQKSGNASAPAPIKP